MVKIFTTLILILAVLSPAVSQKLMLGNNVPDPRSGQAGVMFDISNVTGFADVEIQSFDVGVRPGTWTIHLYYTTGDTYNGVEGTGQAGVTNGDWVFAGSHQVVSTSTTQKYNIPLGFTLPFGQCKGVYLTSTTSIAAGPVIYLINNGGNVFTDGSLTAFSGIGRTAIPGVFTGGTFGTSSGAACTPSANYRTLTGCVNYRIGAVVIPSISQWGLFILSLILVILGTVTIRQKVFAKI